MNTIRFALLLLPCALFAADDDWPRWRGPNNDGMGRGEVPMEWSDSKNIAWRMPDPGRGFSSPVVWGDKIFLTTAVPTQGAAAARPRRKPRSVGLAAVRAPEWSISSSCSVSIGIPARSCGSRSLRLPRPYEGYHRRYGSFASNSPVTDGRHLYAFFGSRGLYKYDLNGKLIWEKQFPPMRMRNQFGEGSATVLDGRTLYLKFDQEEGSYMVALDTQTGKEIWRVARDEVSSWSAPLVVTHNGVRQVVVSATTKVRSYDPATGKIIWETSGLGTNVIPAPVTANGLVYVMSGHRQPNLLAIRLGREGDLTGTDAIAWTNNRGNPYSSSPVLHENKLYFVTDSGMLSCLNALSGEPYYLQQRLPKPYNLKSSPVGASGQALSSHGG